MTSKANMRDAVPHIERAQNSLEMLRLCAENKKISSQRRVSHYYNSLVDSVLELQRLLLTDQDFTDAVSRGIKDVTGPREFHYNLTENEKGQRFIAVDVTLPVKKLKRRVLFSRKQKPVTIWDGGRHV